MLTVTGAFDATVMAYDQPCALYTVRGWSYDAGLVARHELRGDRYDAVSLAIQLVESGDAAWATVSPDGAHWPVVEVSLRAITEEIEVEEVAP